MFPDLWWNQLGMVYLSTYIGSEWRCLLFKELSSKHREWWWIIIQHSKLKPELSSPTTNEQTSLVCWGPKGFNEMKLGLIQRQPGRRVPKDTHMGVTRFSGVHWNQWILNLTARYIRIASTFYETHVEIYYFHTEAHQGANFVAMISCFWFCQKVSHFPMFIFQF